MFPTFERVPGIMMGSGPAKTHLEVFLDLQCPYSKASWDVIGGSLRQAWIEKMCVSLHFITLSHHRQSWDLTRTLFAVRSIDQNNTLSFIDNVYSEHEQFYNAQWKSKSELELLNHLVSFAKRVVDIPDQDLLKLIESDQSYTDAKRSIHYASVKQVWSTPTFFINHMPCNALSSSSSLEDWDTLLAELVDGPWS